MKNSVLVLPVLLFSLTAVPMHAEELQVSFTGQGATLPGGAVTGTYVVSFDINTLSGYQQEGIRTINGVPSVIGFSSGNLSVTNLYESFAGQTAFVRSTTGALSFQALPVANDFAFDTQNFFWDSFNPVAPIPQSQFSLANYLFALSGSTLQADSSLFIDGQDIGLANGTIHVSAVPEPGMLALMLAGFGGLGFMQWAAASARKGKGSSKE